MPRALALRGVSRSGARDCRLSRRYSGTVSRDHHAAWRRDDPAQRMCEPGGPDQPQHAAKRSRSCTSVNRFEIASDAVTPQLARHAIVTVPCIRWRVSRGLPQSWFAGALELAFLAGRVLKKAQPARVTLKSAIGGGDGGWVHRHKAVMTR
jgi:hypothetical protein